MDSLTHLVLGHAMGVFAGGPEPAVQAGAYWGALVGNSLPDIDVPFGHLVGRGWTFHRKFTHTLPGITALSLAAAGVITIAIPGSAWWVTWAWALAGCIVHVSLDCLNVWGTRALWPFSRRAFGAGVLFILDPLILASLGLATLLHLSGWVGPSFVKALYGAMWAYIAARWLLKLRLEGRLAVPGTVRASLAPFLMGFRYFRETADRLEYGRIDLLTGSLTPIESVAANRGPIVEASKADPRVQMFLQGARYPFATVVTAGEGHRVIWQDLFLRIRGAHRQIEVLVGEDLTVLA